MKKVFYPKLAWDGIRKNKRLYLPYILTCIAMSAMFYILAALVYSPVLPMISGGDNIRFVLYLGRGVIAAFSLGFLFYTNSFLIRRRKKEFGLYNILGMGKINIARILCLETLIVYGISIALGVLSGALLSKLAELGLLNILETEVNYTMYISSDAIHETIIVFAVAFLLILLNSLRQLHLSDPLELLRSEEVGEKPPRANWFGALCGLALLGVAYYLAVSIKEPVTALLWFFVAVIMVIAATYLLLISGSVTLCRILQKNKRYYYKPNHFVSVASMVYRMKRNGAGLATICILCTMVLVMISSTASLYIGADDSIRTRYPRNIYTEVGFDTLEAASEENLEAIRLIYSDAAEAYNVEMLDPVDYLTVTTSAFLTGDHAEPDREKAVDYDMTSFDEVHVFYLMDLETVNNAMNTDYALEPGEALLYCTGHPYTHDTLTIGDNVAFNIRGKLDDFFVTGTASLSTAASVFIVVPDFKERAGELLAMTGLSGGRLASFDWYFGFDLDAPDEVHEAIWARTYAGMREVYKQNSFGLDRAMCESSVHERSDFISTYGGLFFLGIMLSIVFILAAVLIIYYKQISEGYEDQHRFQIMQNVGMTKRDIRRSINSQMLTVFLIPLALSALHMGFAFPLVWKLLQLFGLSNMWLLVLVTACCVLVFALFYTLVYRITSNAYCTIVSGAREKKS